MLRKILNPDLYHGKNKKNNFFEGWYFKIVDKEFKNVFAFIPGIIKGNKYKDGHSFIQVLDGNSKKGHYLSYGKDSFKASNKEFYLEINKNSFSLNEIKLNHYSKDLQVIGQLKFVDVIKWPDSKLNPGSMGFYNYLLFMECYSQVCCLDGNIIGKLLVNNKEIDFTGGKVYVEKNWGKKFPIAYIWVQSNSFKEQNVSLTCSIAKIPMFLYSFGGFLVALMINDQVYKFTSINRSKMNIESKGNELKLIFYKDNLKLIIETKLRDEDFINCAGPTKAGMDVVVKESITSKIKVELIDVHREVLIFSAEGLAAGIEMMGDISLIK